MTIDLVTATRLVGPGMARTALAQLRKRKSPPSDVEARSRGQEAPPPDEAVYAESIRLMRQIVKLACVSAVEDLHAVTSRHSPTPASVRVVDVDVPASHYDRAAELVQRQLGPNLDKVGRAWWQWRKPGSETVKAQWIEMKVDYEERMRMGDEGKKVMFYVHGGAYYLGGMGHDMQIQRHARKLKGRCFAPRYRLAPQFPFPCAIHDIVSAYMYLLTLVKPEHVVLAGDSAGSGICLALLVIIRDQGLPMPAGASLISPWVDLTSSFPSIAEPSDFDYVPNTGFHAKPTLAWPPPSPDERCVLGMKENSLMPPDFVVNIDGKPLTITNQVNMYAPNQQLLYPLISPLFAASLGGLCPCQVIVGGAEILRDEQLYLAHKMADPAGFPLSDRILLMNGEDPADQHKFRPTDVELLVFDDGPHAAPTLGHIDIARHQYRAVAQFAARALAKAQNAEIEIEEYCSLGHVSPTQPRSREDSGRAREPSQHNREARGLASPETSNNIAAAAMEENFVDLRAGNTLPPFQDHMRRYRVDRSGKLRALEAPHLLRALNVPIDQAGEVKGQTLKGWLKVEDELNLKFASEKTKVFRKRQNNARKGYLPVPNGEIPPHSALVGRRVIGDSEVDTSTSGSGTSILGGLLRKLEKGGPAANGRKDTMEDVELKSPHGGRRGSRVVRPDRMSPS